VVGTLKARAVKTEEEGTSEVRPVAVFVRVTVKVVPLRLKSAEAAPKPGGVAYNRSALAPVPISSIATVAHVVFGTEHGIKADFEQIVTTRWGVAGDVSVEAQGVAPLGAFRETRSLPMPILWGDRTGY
jgi:hypothetical protein